MTKIEALEKLNNLIEQLLPITEYSSDEFYKWRLRSERNIKKIFNDDSYYERLSKVRYLPIGMMFGNTMSKYEKKQEFESGKKWAINILESFYEEVEEWKDDNTTINNTSPQTAQINASNKVFIVHGHDNGAKQEVARFLEKLDLEPIILHEQASSQKTIIEKIESYAGQVGFGVVLYTACDDGKAKSETELKNRARQNVVFEHGYLIGLLGRNRVCPLVKGSIETPGDISGVVYTPMDDSGSWHLPLAKELRTAGYTIDLNLL
ncbi:TIR domain-containing protein [Aliarcobacter butzleri]|uniref:TIR domain-containing protein n=1 Tax=Aliarcobacter butzleri TaxID=28197 RepID=UPI001EDAF21B|nr:nucleotide-binding protein [Aliarcobacter butzleri]MCG3675601.1 nucleotide-binding protein [Aliarcobacter butzleri]